MLIKKRFLQEIKILAQITIGNKIKKKLVSKNNNFLLISI